MRPTTLELLRDMLREGEFLHAEAGRTTRDACLHEQGAHPAMLFRPVVESAGRSN